MIKARFSFFACTYLHALVLLTGIACLADPENVKSDFSRIAAAKSVSFTIDSERVIGRVDERIYGQFLEHIYHSCSQGLWGEVVWNGGFEERLTPDDWVVKEGCLVSPLIKSVESRFTLGTEWTDCELNVEVMKLSGTGEVLAGLNCNANNNYLLVLGTDGHHRLELAVNVPLNQGTVVQTAEGQRTEVGRWMKVQLRREKRRVQAWVDGQRVLDFTNEKAGPIKGGVCLGVRNSQARFRNLEITDLSRISFNTFDLAAVKAADVFGKLSLGQIVLVERPRLDEISIAVACWRGIAGKGFRLQARSEGPEGRLIASRQLPPGLREGELASLDIWEPFPVGTLLYVEMIPDAGIGQEILGWWSKDENLYTNGTAYVNGQPVTGDRFVRLSYLAHSNGASILSEGLPLAARHWRAFGQGQLFLDRDRPLNGGSSMNILCESGETGLFQDNYCVRKGDKLRGSVWLRGDAQKGVVVRLTQGPKVLAENTLKVKTDGWKEFPLELDSNVTAQDAALHILTKDKANVWIDQVSLMPDSARATGGFRPDLLKAVVDLRPATIRWPGGSFVYGYQWKHGIGPREKRTLKSGWDELDLLSFGTDEFVQLCRKTGAEPVICFDIGPASRPELLDPFIQNACDWVEYCNGPAASTWGAARANNGHPKPYRVKYWELGNEVWSLTRQQYAAVLKAFAPAIKKVDPTVQLIGCGGTLGAIGAENDLAVIEDCANLVDLISIHHYEDPNRFVQGVTAFDDHIISLGERIAKSSNPGMKVYVSEWNTLNCQDWRGGLYAGGLLNAFERNNHVAMSCPALWLRHLSAPDWANSFINFDSRGWYPAPNYVVMKLFRDSYAPNRLEIAGDSGGLSVIATKTDDAKRMYVKAVNPLDKTVNVELGLKSRFRPSVTSVKLIMPDSLEARNYIEHPELVKVVTGEFHTMDGKYLLTLPRWSVGVVQFDYDKRITQKSGRPPS